MKKAVVLYSGGLDSTTCMAIARHEGFDPYAMSFAYGQRHAVELAEGPGVRAAGSVRWSTWWSISTCAGSAAAP